MRSRVQVGLSDLVEDSGVEHDREKTPTRGGRDLPRPLPSSLGRRSRSVSEQEGPHHTSGNLGIGMVTGSTWVPIDTSKPEKKQVSPDTLPPRLERATREACEELRSSLVLWFESSLASAVEDLRGHCEERLESLEGLLARATARVTEIAARRIDETFLPKLRARIQQALDEFVTGELTKAVSKLNARAGYVDSYCERWRSAVGELDPEPGAEERMRSLAALKDRGARLVSVLEELHRIVTRSPSVGGSSPGPQAGGKVPQRVEGNCVENNVELNATAVMMLKAVLSTF